MTEQEEQKSDHKHEELNEKKMEAITEWAGSTARANEHAAKETEHANNRKKNTDIAKDSEVPILERGKAAGNAIMEGVKELTEAGKRKIEEVNAQRAQSKL